MSEELNELIKQRIAKIADFEAAGEIPYAYQFNRTHLAVEVLDQFKEIPKKPKKKLKLPAGWWPSAATAKVVLRICWTARAKFKFTPNWMF
jgi:lysyl-tRNA synthetase class II